LSHSEPETLGRAVQHGDVPGSRKCLIVSIMLWTVVATTLRAARLPNDFSKEHWFIDYRFGFVKRGLIGTIVSLTTGLLHVRETEQLINILSIAQFVVFCIVMMTLGLHLVRRSGWSIAVTLVVLVFLSSPFMVMSAHLIGYYDNIILVLTVLSLVMLFRARLWLASALQTISILVHENSLLVGFPVFFWAWWLVKRRGDRSSEGRWPFWPVVVPPAAFMVVMISQRFARPSLERRLTRYLSSYPFIARTIGDVKVPHWITITFYDSYLLHQGQFLGRVLSQPMIGLVLPSLLAIMGFVFEANDIGPVSSEAVALLGVCLAPQMMHVMAWDTARIWTYSIVCGFLLLYVYVKAFPTRTMVSPFIRLLCLVALFLNVIDVTPLMDGLADHFEVTTRLLIYAPLLIGAVILNR
jgi:hypothetical protein